MLNVSELSNEELEKQVCQSDFMDRDLVREYDRRLAAGIITYDGPELSTPEEIEAYFEARRKRRAQA